MVDKGDGATFVKTVPSCPTLVTIGCQTDLDFSSHFFSPYVRLDTSLDDAVKAHAEVDTLGPSSEVKHGSFSSGAGLGPRFTLEIFAGGSSCADESMRKDAAVAVAVAQGHLEPRRSSVGFIIEHRLEQQMYKVQLIPSGNTIWSLVEGLDEVGFAMLAGLIHMKDLNGSTVCVQKLHPLSGRV